MLKALLFSLTTALAAMATAQTNFVPNGSFEDTVDCYTFTQSTLLKAEHWRNPNTATPDVFDCDLERLCGIAMDPTSVNNPPGYYRPAYDGERFAGSYCWFGPGSSNTREYLMVKLTGTMEPGMAYEVGLHYVMPQNCRFAVDHIGVWFGPDSLFEATPNWLSVSPQVRLREQDSPYLTAAAWTALSDTFMAQGGERWMVIGNFDEADSVNGILINPDGLSVQSYYFMDMVHVELLGNPQGLLELIGGWQGSALWLRWPDGTRPDAVELFDMAGRLVLRNQAPMGEREILWDLPGLANGVYVVRVLQGMQQRTLKVIKGGE